MEECIFPNRGRKNKILNKKNMFKKYVIGNKVKFKIDLILLTTFGTSKNKHYNELNINSDIKHSDMIG
ncbi:MAG: hypothetical protein U9N59_08340 [Campylobacterota bacterium]|nr:hypothetical protein [Campylobacterota bacterium]